MKRYVAIFLTMCLVFSTTIPVSNLIVWAASQIDHAEIGVEDFSDFGDIGEDDAGLVGADSGESAGLGDADSGESAGLGRPDEDGENTELGELDKDGDGDIDESNKDGDVETGGENAETGKPGELEETEKDQDITKDNVYLNIFVDEYRNVDIDASHGISYAIEDNFGKDDNYDECDIVIFFGTDEGIEIREDDISVYLPEEWSYEIDIDSGTVTITPEFMLMRSLSSKVIDVWTWAELSTEMGRINNGNVGYTDPDITIRLRADLTCTGAGQPVRPAGRTVRIVADNQNRRITVDRGSVFSVQSGATLIISGGSDGGTLEFIGWNNPAGMSTCFAVSAGGVVEVHSGVTIRDFVQSGVHVNGGTFRLYGNAHLLRNRWVSPGNGGGVRIANGGLFEMYGGIIERGTAQRGGGVHVSDGSRFHMYGGQIIDCFATIDGGGVYVQNGRYENVTIARAAVLSGNVAQNGMRIDNSLPDRFPLINPGTVSIPDKGYFLGDDGQFATIPPHAFTNYDINTTGPQYWRVTSEARNTGGSNGRVTAEIEETGILVPDGAFVPEGTEIMFISEGARLDRWEIGDRATETDQDKRPIAFSFRPGGSDVPLVYEIFRHTHIIGHFAPGGVTITFDPNGGLGEPYVHWMSPGVHTLTHKVTHENEAFTHVGWVCENGISYKLGDNINVTEDIVLFAQWQGGATTLTISKEVTGNMGNYNREFEFTIIFHDASDKPLAAQHFNYIGGIIEDSGATAPANGVLVTDSEGKATFWLKHGQSIIIEDIALSSRVQIIVEDDFYYITSFIDSESDGEPVFENDTTMQAMTENRAFLFTNNREAPPAGGLNIDHNGGLLIMVIGVISLWALLLSIILRRRMNFAKKHPIGCIG